MATSVEQIKTGYPLPVFNFRVRIEGETYGFSQVTGLRIQYDTVTYKHGLSWSEGAEEVIGLQQPVNITFQRGMVAKSSALLRWISNVHRSFLGPPKRDVFIDLCDEDGNPVITWTINNAIPIKLDAPSFDANNNDVAIESMELKAAGVQITYH